MAARRLFLVRRRVTVRDLPEARVTGAEPAKACRPGRRGTCPVVACLGEHDGAADVGQAREAGDDRVVRVLAERLCQRGRELAAESQTASSTLSRARISVRIACSTTGSWRSCGVRSAATMPRRPGGDPALPAGAAQRRLDPRRGYPQALRRAGRDRQHGPGIAAGQLGGRQPAPGGERGQEPRVVLLQPGPQLLHQLGAPPHRVLIRAGEHRDRPGQATVVRQHAVQVRVGAQDVRQRHRISMVALFTRHRRAFPVPGHRQRVDRVNRPPGSAQHGDQQPAGGLDRDRDQILRAVTGRGEHRGQLRDSLHALGDPPFGDQCAVAVNQRDVVMPLSPVDAAVHRHR